MKQLSVALMCVIGLFISVSYVAASEVPSNKGVVSVVVLKVGVIGNLFEGGAISRHRVTNGIEKRMPLKIDHKPARDFGSVTISLPETGEVVFKGGIVWDGLGQISVPEHFIPASEFQKGVSELKASITNLSPEKSFGKSQEDIMAAWEGLKNLKLLKSIENRPYLVGVYHYAPTIGMYDPNVAKWLFFVCVGGEVSFTNEDGGKAK